MRPIVIVTAAAAASIAAAMLGGGAANAAEPTCTTYMLNDRATFTMDAKTAAHREIHYVAHRYESTPGCFTAYYDTTGIPGHLGYGGRNDSGSTINYVGNGEFDITQTLNYNDDAVVVSWIGQSRDAYGDDNPGYINPNSGPIDVRGRGYVAVKVTVKNGIKTVAVLAKRYSNTEQSNIAWSRARVQIQQLKHGSWVTIKSTTATRAGKASATVGSAKRSFRAVVASSDLAWGTTSKVIKK